MQQFFYDEQIRRFLLQFTRIFSGFQIEYGREEGSENAALLRVPIRYGDSSRNAQTILQDNSRNSLPSTPLMTFYITALDYDRPRIQEPYHVSKVSVRQRTYDTSTETYETTQGNAFTIERLMPVPYKLTLNLDLWTSNTNQKLQLLEQILTLFNPSLEIQSTDNYIDWTSLSVVELDGTTWTSRTIPMGAENPIDICTLRFTLPIWISSPAKVKKLGVVERVIASVFDAQGDAVDAIQPDGSEVVGTIALDPNDDRFVLYDIDIDTAPQNTLDAIDAVINPQASGPLNGLDSALEGQRYLLTESTGSAGNSGPAEAWIGANGRPLVAEANDVIEYSNNYWRVVFRANGQPAGQYVTNITTSQQYMWTGDAWMKSYQGYYPGGQWRLVL